MRKTLYAYILKEIFVPFLLGMMAFTIVLLMGRFMKLADLVVAKGVPVTDILRLVGYLLPYFSVLTIPMAFLLALLLAFGRLSADSEIVALKACGVGLYHLLPPVLSCALIAYVVTTAIAVWAVPWGNSAFKELILATLQSKANLTIKEAVFNDEFPGVVLYVDRYDKGEDVMHGILIEDERNPADPTTVFAESGRLATDADAKVIRLQLNNGSIHRTLDRTGYRVVQFLQYDLSINLKSAVKGVIKDEQDMTLDELRNLSRSPLLTAKIRMDMILEYHRRFALPFACLVFVFIGMPLGIQNRRSGKGAGFAVSIGILLLYYIVLAAGRACGERGFLSPGVAVWTPNVLFLAFGLYLFKTTAAERNFFLYDVAATAVSRLREFFSRRRAAT